MVTNGQPHASLSRRRFLQAGAALTGSALLAACAGGGGARGGPSQPQSAGSSGQAYVPDRVVKVGILSPVTGSFALAAVLNQAGMRHALKEYEQKGWRFEVIVEDDRGDPTTGLRAAQKLIERDRVHFMLGPIVSSVALAVRDICDQSKTILSTSSAVARELTGSRCSRYIWRSTPTSYMYGLGYGPWLAQHLGKRAYVLTLDYTAGIEVAEAIMDGFRRHGGEIVGYAKAPLATTDFAPYMGPLLESRADFVTGFIAGRNAIDALKAFHQFGIKDRMAVAMGVAFTSNDIIDAQGPEATEGVYEYVEFSESLDTPEYRAWAQLHHQWFPEVKRIAHFNAHGYTAAKSVLLGIERAGSLDPDRIAAAMEGLTWQAPHGPIAFGPNHQATINMYVTQVRDMKHIVLDTIENQTDPNAHECRLT
jgi:branched-chain amino acid transport system substrate-binding protein